MPHDLETMFNEVKKFMPAILANEVKSEKMRRGEIDMESIMREMQNRFSFVSPGGQPLIVTMN